MYMYVVIRAHVDELEIKKKRISRKIMSFTAMLGNASKGCKCQHGTVARGESQKYYEFGGYGKGIIRLEIL